jgi:hypothetical protein
VLAHASKVIQEALEPTSWRSVRSALFDRMGYSFSAIAIPARVTKKISSRCALGDRGEPAAASRHRAGQAGAGP